MKEKRKKLIEDLLGGLVVSCQAFSHEPLYGVDVMVKLAIAARQGGASAIRASWPENISAIRRHVDLPIFGINKIMPEHYDKMRDVIITPTLEAAQAVYYAGADIIAVDATLRGGRTQKDISELIRQIKDSLDVLVMGEVSTLEEGLLAEDGGADIVSTTIAGYTHYSRKSTEPDYELIEELVKSVKIPVNAEGRFHRPEQVKRAFDCGAWTVTVGSAITRPHFITEQFVKGMK